jgi:8-oxo-dGTP pyrophosphatase MutT (NUDIX family)
VDDSRVLSTGGSWKVGVDWRFESWVGDPPSHEVAGVELVPFVGEDCVVARLADGRIMRPGGTAEPHEHWVITARRELAEETGAKLLTLHPFGIFRCRWRKRPKWLVAHHPYPEFVRVIAWCDAALVGPPGNPVGAEQVSDVLTLSPADAAAMFVAQGRREYADLYEMAAALRGAGIDDECWFRDAIRLLENTYLAAADPFGQVGMGGGAADWELGRRPQP